MPNLAQYEKIRSRYQNEKVAGSYDDERFGGLGGSFRNARVLKTIGRALDHPSRLGHPVRRLLDVPVGTGRLVPLTLSRKTDFVGADLSLEMIKEAADKLVATGRLEPFPFVRCDAEHLPFRENTFDATVTLRFMRHLPREVRIKILQELGRVTRKWVIIDCRNRLNLGFVLRTVKRALRLPTRDCSFWSKAEIAVELQESSLQLIRLFPAAPYLSDQWIVLAAKGLGDPPS